MSAPDLPLGRRPIDRRTLLTYGGVTISLGALVAACGGDSLGSDGPGRVGVAVPTPTLGPTEVDDVVLLRTAQSLEYTALEVYALAAATGGLDAEQIRLVDAIVADHTAHAAALAELIGRAGGQSYACANPWIMRRIVEPVVNALDATDDLTRDLLNIAFAVETLAANTYQMFVGMLEDPGLRTAALDVGADEARHTAALALAISGIDGALSPVLFGEELSDDAEGFPIAYAVPSRFSEVRANELVVGRVLDDGSRFSINIQTPAENAYIYDDMSC